MRKAHVRGNGGREVREHGRGGFHPCPHGAHRDHQVEALVSSPTSLVSSVSPSILSAGAATVAVLVFDSKRRRASFCMSMASFCMLSFMSTLLMTVLRAATAEEADEGFRSSNTASSLGLRRFLLGLGGGTHFSGSYSVGLLGW
ncbi:hypothetical protein NL676_004415 [Syzygium grande]|nr:hypothetical protein NL676_004415 [Syzygium grande]